MRGGSDRTNNSSCGAADDNGIGVASVASSVSMVRDWASVVTPENKVK